MVVVSKCGTGRAGCFTAVAVAYELLRSPEDTPTPFDSDTSLLDSVLRGLRRQRPRLVSNLRQFQFCHHMLAEALWGKPDSGDAKPPQKKERKKWKLFKKKKSERIIVQHSQHSSVSIAPLIQVTRAAQREERMKRGAAVMRTLNSLHDYYTNNTSHTGLLEYTKKLKDLKMCWSE